MRWDDARVVIVEVLCTPAQRDQLLVDVTATLRAVEHASRLEPGRWTTSNTRLRGPRSEEEREWLLESLAQPDDPSADERQAMVLEIGGRGSGGSAERVSEALRRALCPDDFHVGPCPIPWGTMTRNLRHGTRDEKVFYRDFFPRAGRRQASHAWLPEGSPG